MENKKEIKQGETIRLYKKPQVALTRLAPKEYLLIDVKTNKVAKFREVGTLNNVVASAYRLIDNGALN